MDGFVVIVLAVILYFVYRPKEEAEVEIESTHVVRKPTLNPEMIHAEHAFMEIANELGFH